MRGVLLPIILMVAAGRTDWLRGWLFWLVMMASFAACSVAAHRKNPGLFRARMEKPAGTKPFDRVILAIMSVGFAAIVILAGLGARFNWSSLSFRWVFPGLLLQILGMIPIGLAMAANPFLERTVRIQNDRGQVVVTSGPYRIVRHPMYVGALLVVAAWPLLLGSVWSFIPLAVIAPALIVRTALEDRTLHRELAGYADYAQRTRYRLLPGVW
jgi:protein-S-isoprenylcysteine O-methyltransferase Ste14